MFVLIWFNGDDDIKSLKAQKYLPKDNIKNYNVIVNEKDSYDQLNDSDIKWYKEIRKVTTGQGEDYTTECLLDSEYIKNHYRLMPVDLSR